MHAGVIFTIAFAPSGDQLVTVDSSRELSNWMIPSGTQAIHQRLGTGQVNNIAFNQSGKQTFTGSPTDGVRIWRNGLSEFNPHDIATDGAAVAVKTARTAEVAMVATASGQVLHWQTQEPDRPISEFRVASPIRNAEVSHDGSRIAVATANQHVEIWNRDDSQLAVKAADILLGQEVPILCFAPNSPRVLAVQGSHAQVWATRESSDLEQQLAADDVRAAWFIEGRGSFVTRTVIVSHPS